MTNRKGLALTLAAVAVLVFFYVSSCSRVLIYVQPDVHRKDKKAVIVLPGLRNSSKGHSTAKKWYPKQGYDVFIPDYVSRDGFEGNIANLEALIKEHRLEEYGEVYAFVYLMGGWTLNKYLQTHEFPNLKKIIYDRSPLQEQGPRIVLENMPGIIHLIYGCPVDQLRDTPYPPLPKGEREIGIIIECRASPFISKNRDQLRPIAGEDWLPEAFNQEHDDYMYVFLHHDEMYYKYDEIGDSLISFFETGRFPADARRKPFDRDPFE